ncbi:MULTISPECIES: recombinase family protein [unclassified Clostridium]|uniref:recombinase family protein n=1 Tax=unclassified Clostridium TaxID=2614128 RepID=UPI001C8C7C3C|nr:MULTISPECIES: recombinase family protein [unclassified Clostridium]MBX9136640.1 recombinase family protein [Clostridium sp. K12(2020)]MBX9144834.1 recombinase family protein [Clostridium sp. K13]
MNVAIYARKSKNTKKGESIENQIDLCKKYFLNSNPEAENVNFLLYVDEGKTGENTNRPQFQKMIHDAKNKRFECLICYKLDRIARDVADFSTSYKILQKNNIDFVSITEQFDTTTIIGRGMINIAATFAQIERETIAERVRDNMLELSKTGRWLGGTPPLGFKSVQIQYEHNGQVKNMFKLEVVPEEMEIVRLIYSLYPQYKSTVPIARYLVSNYIKGKNGGDFSRNTVLQILKNPVYCCSDAEAIKYFENKGSTLNCNEDNELGLMVYNKRKGGKKENPVDEWIIATGKHPGVISGVEWIKCQNILSEISSKISPRKATGNKFLLSGLLKCAKCGSSMCSWSRTNRGIYYRSYRCELKNRSATRCDQKMVNADELEEFVIDLCKNINLEDIINSKKTKNNNAALKRELTTLNKNLIENDKVLQGLIKKLALLDDLDILSMIQKEIKNIKTENDNINKKINEINLSIFDVEDEGNKKQILLESHKIFKDTIDLIEDVEAKRNLIMNFIEYFTYNSETNEVGYKLRL